GRAAGKGSARRYGTRLYDFCAVSFTAGRGGYGQLSSIYPLCRVNMSWCRRCGYRGSVAKIPLIADYRAWIWNSDIIIRRERTERVVDDRGQVWLKGHAQRRTAKRLWQWVKI